MYKLTPSQDEPLVFFHLDGEAAERYGFIGCLRMDFGKNGDEFYTTWFDKQPHLKTPGFKKEFDGVICILRDGGPEPPFASRASLKIFCAETPGKELNMSGGGYMLRTKDYSYYFRCKPSAGDYDVYRFIYDNRWLLPELAGQHELPDICYSTSSTTGEIILIRCGERGYYRCEYSTDDLKYNREFAKDRNIKLSVTQAQVEAMVNGSLIGWDVPAAKPWNYDQDGKLRKQPPKKTEIAR